MKASKLFQKQFIEKELMSLDIERGSDAWDSVFNQAINAADILTRSEVKNLISELVETMPFETRSI